MKYDVVIVGASMAGCAAAILYGKRGLSVALVDRVSEIDAYKLHCTHYILGSAKPVFEKLGIASEMDESGGVVSQLNFWTPYGNIAPDTNSESDQAYNIPRYRIDPILRRLAQDTPGVELMLGLSFEKLIVTKGRVEGVSVKPKGGASISLEAKLVVGADGRNSKVAKQSGLKKIEKTNNRFCNFAYYEGLPLATGNNALVWYTNPDIGYCFPTADGRTLVATFIGREKYDSWKSNTIDNIECFIGSLPGSPDFDKATRVSDVGAMLRMPSIRYKPAENGLALIGDAAMSSDPTTGVGCSWALQSADMLVEYTASSLKNGRLIDRSLKKYCRQHAARFNAHFEVIAEEAKAKPFNLLQKAVFSAAVKDRKLAHIFHTYGNRNISMLEFLAIQIPRSIWVNITNEIDIDIENYSYKISGA